MKTLFAFLLLPLLPLLEPKITWLERGESFNMNIPLDRAMLEQCLAGGFAVRVRVAMQVCESRSPLFPDCSQKRVRTATLRLDAVAEQYRLSRDLKGDSLEPTEQSFTDLESAFGELASIEDVQRASLYDEPAAAGYEFLYLRISSDCQGERNATLARLGQVLTLGILSDGIADSGWMRFSLATVAAEKK